MEVRKNLSPQAFYSKINKLLLRFNTVLLLYFYRCTVHFENSLNITTNKCTDYIVY
jgi:hypothetical protein